MPWYYAIDGKPFGPVTDEEIQQLAKQGTVAGQSLVWCDDMKEWQPWSVAGPLALPGRQFCQGCGGLFPADDLVQLQGTLVCASCKPLHLQRMREGLLPQGPMGVP